ncbi:MAG: Wzz/FepE/Etk N-terminal domain-containing protein [Bacteroidales bacterium]
MEQKNYKKEEQEIDLVEIVQKLWKNRKFILKVTAAFAVLGLLVAIFSSNIYTASCTMVPQTGEKKAGGNLSGLAAMAGINIGSLSSGEVLSPTVYPKIMTNINFQKELIYSKFHFKEIKEPITLYDFYTDKQYQKFNLLGTIKKYTIGLPGVIIKAIKGNKDAVTNSDTSTVQFLTKEEQEVIKALNESLTLEVNDKQGFITLTTNMSEPLAVAELAQKGQELLQKYITEFKVEKVASNLEFVERSYDEAKRNFETKQEELARFRDANKSLSSAMARTQEEKLTSEYDLLLQVYTELAKQKEQAKIAVTETTPILTIISPVVVPTEKTKPKRSLILLIYIFLGLVIGAGIVFFVPYLEDNFLPNIKDYRFIPKIN